MRRSLARLALLPLLAPSLAASTYVVDDNGGPGVDFVGIDQAIASAVPGDVLLVRTGTYLGFTLPIGISILGEPGAKVIDRIEITGVPAGQRVTLAGLTTSALTVSACEARVTLEELVSGSGAGFTGLIATITIRGSADVRLRGVEAGGGGYGLAALWVKNSRVEVTHSILTGASGRNHDIYIFPGPPTNGGDAILVTRSTLHLSSSAVRGGRGGELPSTNLCPPCHGGAGGVGIRISDDSEVFVVGPDYASVVGGRRGETPFCSNYGPAGDGIVVGSGSLLRVSGAQILPGEGGWFPGDCEDPNALAIRGPFVAASPADPALTIPAAATGTTFSYVVTGEPGAAAQLLLGRTMVAIDVAGVDEDQLVVPLRTVDLGPLPASGIATYQIALPALLPGAILVAQARTTLAGVVSLTQSMPITVR